jgi:hypothetical protein
MKSYHKTKTNKTKTQHNKCWATTLHKQTEGTQDEDKQNKTQHNNKCWAITLHKQTDGTQDEDKQKHNTTISVEHHST